MSNTQNLSVRRHLSTARTIMRRARSRIDELAALDLDCDPIGEYRRAAGHIAAACKIMSKPSSQVIRLLRLAPGQSRLLSRINGPVGCKLRNAGRPPLTCVLGKQCTCTSQDQKGRSLLTGRCGNWRRIDPSAFDIVGEPCQDPLAEMIPAGDVTNEPLE